MNMLDLAEMTATLKKDPATSHMKLRVQQNAANGDDFFDYYVVTEDDHNEKPTGVVGMTRWHMDGTWKADWRGDKQTFRLENEFESPQKAMRAALEARSMTTL